MEVNDIMIENLAHLARLQFTDLEKNEFKTDLQRMITFVEQLKEVDTTNVKPLLHLSDTVNVLREDVLVESISQELALKNAPKKDNNFFLVPKVIKK